MGLRHKSSDEEHVAPQPDPYGGALATFGGMSVPDRAATVLSGIASVLESDTSFQNKTQRKLLDQWLPEPPGRWPPAFMELWKVLAEAFTMLEQARLLIAAQTDRSSGGALTCYWLSDDGRSALDRGDVAAVVARRIPS
jgi:hypothetical protein